MPAYLDNASTTPMREEAIEAMMPFLRGSFANPSGTHALARDARRAVEKARLEMADVLGAQPGEIVFTSGGTEGDNTSIHGVMARRGGVAVCPATEHHAVLEPVVASGGRVVAVDASGAVDMDSLAAAVDPTVSVVSVMLVNNETGVIAPLAEIAQLVHRRAPDAVLHTDAVQALSWVDVARVAAVADLVSVSAHKFGGPKGVGVLVVRDGVDLAPHIVGGGQERERRGGTHNVAGIVAAACAARLTVDERDTEIERVTKLRDRLADGLVASVSGVTEAGVPRAGDGPDRSQRVAGICHVCVEGVDSEAILLMMERSDVFASAGASCASGAMEPSHVLAAMGVPHDLAKGSLRLSLGHETTDSDIDLALEVIPSAIRHLRERSDRGRV